MKPITVKQFNSLQNCNYSDYCTKCNQNGIKPEPQSRYFPTLSIKYGYVIYNKFNEIYWKKRKSDFNY